MTARRYAVSAREWQGPVLDGVNAYIDQDGIAWRADCGTCPRCLTPTDYGQRMPGSGYFRCTCGVMYDEPVWIGEEAYLGEYAEVES